MDVRILKEQLPVIQINFEEMKTALAERLEQYQGVIVTENSLGECKEAQKELAGVRIKIDNYRKDKKKELSKPITEFENQCKELIGLIEQVEQPIKEGIKVYDDIRRGIKNTIALDIIKEVITEQELNEKYAARLDVLERYCNLSIKEVEVRNDIESRAMALKVEQDREAELINIVKDTIEFENIKLKTKMRIDEFQKYFNMGMTATQVMNEVRERASKIWIAENPTIEIPKEEIKASEPEKVETEIQQLYYADFYVTGTLAQLRAVSKFLKDNHIDYKVKDQGELE